MYHVLSYKPFIYFETASDRDSLNEKADYTHKYLNGYCPDDGVNEETCYGDSEISYSEFVKKNPQYKNYIKLSLKQFRDNL